MRREAENDLLSIIIDNNIARLPLLITIIENMTQARLGDNEIAILRYTLQ